MKIRQFDTYQIAFLMRNQGNWIRNLLPDPVNSLVLKLFSTKSACCSPDPAKKFRIHELCNQSDCNDKKQQNKWTNKTRSDWLKKLGNGIQNSCWIRWTAQKTVSLSGSMNQFQNWESQFSNEKLPEQKKFYKSCLLYPYYYFSPKTIWLTID